MFTGIIQELGRVEQTLPGPSGIRLRVSCPKIYPELKVDDSVAINGVCQTVVSLSPSLFEVDCVHISLQKTTLGSLRPGDKVNLELAMRPMDRLGGHLVQGHVNGKGQILRFYPQGQNIFLWLEIPQDILPYVVKEGSLCLDGISLTVAEIDQNHQNHIGLSIIPHTWQHTNLHLKKVRDFINIEVDILAKYVESMLIHRFSSTPSNNKPDASSWVHWSREKGYTSEK